MKCILALLCALCLVSTASGYPTLDYCVTHTGTYTPTGMTTPVDLYTLSFAVSPYEVGAIVLDVGSDYLGYGSNPFQVGVDLGGMMVYYGTPTAEDAAALSEATFARQADSHFLFPGSWVPAVFVPTESNDASLGTYVAPNGFTEIRGLGGMRVATAVPVAYRTQSIDVASVAIPQGSAVYFSGQIADSMGHVRDIDDIQLPMPGQSTWIGPGAGGTIPGPPTDPSMRSDIPGNWSGGVLPGPLDDVRIQLSGAETLVAGSAHVGSLLVDSLSDGTSFHVPAEVDLVSTGSIIVGAGGTMTAVQDGNCQAALLALGMDAGSRGVYELREGNLLAECVQVGVGGGGQMTQTGGSLQAAYALRVGGSVRPAWSSNQNYHMQGGQLEAGTLNVGWRTAGTFRQTGGSVTAGEVRIWHSLSRFDLEEGQLRTDRLVVDSGIFRQTGGLATVESELVLGGCPISPGAYDLNGGTLCVGKIVKGPGYVDFHNNGGVLIAGEIAGAMTVTAGRTHVQTMDSILTNDGGVVCPGNSIGMMSLGGFEQVSGTLEIELGSLMEFDKVEIADAAILGGDLDVLLLGGYLPAWGDEFPVLTAGGGISGAFEAISAGFETRIDGGGTLMLVSVPEPAAVLLLALGAAVLLGRRSGRLRR